MVRLHKAKRLDYCRYFPRSSQVDPRMPRVSESLCQVWPILLPVTPAAGEKRTPDWSDSCAVGSDEETAAGMYTGFCCAMLASSSALDVMLCPCVRLSCSWILSKRMNVSLKNFHCRVAIPFWFFNTKQAGEAEIMILSQYLVSLHAVNRSSGKCNILICYGPWQVYNTSWW